MLQFLLNTAQRVVQKHRCQQIVFKANHPVNRSHRPIFLESTRWSTTCPVIPHSNYLAHVLGHYFIRTKIDLHYVMPSTQEMKNELKWMKLIRFQSSCVVSLLSWWMTLLMKRLFRNWGWSSYSALHKRHISMIWWKQELRVTMINIKICFHFHLSLRFWLV